MQITIDPETPDEFTARVAGLLQDPATHVYFDTSFMMWLTSTGDLSRSQFVSWAGTLAERTHVPLWSMHEYYRHHTADTLRARLGRRADRMMAAAKAFEREIQRYPDRDFTGHRSASAFQDVVRDAVQRMRRITITAKDWSYERSAADVMRWMNSRACETTSVFASMPSLRAEGSARFTQDVPPGFMDRGKKDTRSKGSNRYGDLLFWQEVIQHAKGAGAATVIIITRDRKDDWYNSLSEPEPEMDWVRLKAKWLPVPQPHPTLAFEMKVEAGATLVLLDELYLGALLWKFGRPQFERLAAVAIDVTPDHFVKADPISRTIAKRAAKRGQACSIGQMSAGTMLDAAIGAPDAKVQGILAELEKDAPDVDAFLDGLGAETFEGLSCEAIASLCSELHQRAKSGPGPAESGVRKLLDLLDELPADTAAAAYLGFLCSAYFANGVPSTRPDSPFIEELLEWQTDSAFEVVLRVFARRLRTVRSPSLYHPGNPLQDITLRFVHDATLQQAPVVLDQVYLGRRGLFSEGETRPDYRLATVYGRTDLSLDEIARAICRHYGLASSMIGFEGGEPDDRRLIPETLGFVEFDRFTQPVDKPVDGVDDLDLSEEPDVEGDDDESLEYDD